MPEYTSIINGEPGNRISIDDRGLNYGDGLFETLAVRSGQPLLWEAHYQRLQQGCERLAITAPSEGQLLEEAAVLIAGQDRAVLKIIVTRGAGRRGYAVDGNGPPHSRILSCSTAPDWPAFHWERGVHARLCDLQLSRQTRLAGIKHLNRLEQVLARMEWNDPGIHEGLLCDTEGNLVEGIHSNVFWFQGDDLCTAGLEHCGVAGIMREQVMLEAKRLGLPVRTTVLHRHDINKTDGMFVTNSLIGIWPVCAIDEVSVPVPEPLQQLQSAVREVCHAP